MEVGTEISQKIRSAIKAKLMELGAYVDDELPDYIMVMVANKKTPAQMKSDLGLFLGANTDTFTGWLHGLLGKLQTITVDSSKAREKPGKSKGSKEKKKEKDKSQKTDKKDTGKDKKKSNRRNSDGVAKKKATSSSGDKITDDNANSEELQTDSQATLQNENKDSVKEVLKSSNEEVEDVRQLLVTETPADELAKELETSETEIEQIRTVEEVSEKSKTKPTSVLSKVKDMRPNSPTSRGRSRSPSPDRSSFQKSTLRKRKAPVSVVANINISRKEENEEEYDPFNPAVGSVASVVKVTSRKSNVPAGMQANRDSNDTELDGKSEGMSHTSPGEPPSKMMKLSETVSLENIREVLADVMKKAQEEKDHISHFATMVESTLRKLRAQDVSLAKLRVQQVLYQFETMSTNPNRDCPPSDVNLSVPISSSNSFPTHEVTDAQMESGSGKFSRIERLPMGIKESGSETALHNTFVSSMSEPQNSNRRIGDKRDADENIEKSELEKSSEKDGDVKRIIFQPKSTAGQTKESKKRLRSSSYSHDSPTKSSTKREARLSEPTHDDQKPQSPVSSSRVDSAGSPSSIHSCPSSSSPGFNPLILRKCTISSSNRPTDSAHSPDNAHFAKSAPSTSEQIKTDQVKQRSQPSISVDSIHIKRRLESDATPSVLKQNWDRDSSLPGASHPLDTEDNVDSPRQISSEALKVLAKNLKVTVINKRATSLHQGSSSEDSSSEESDDDSSEEDDEEDETEEQAEDGNVKEKQDGGTSVEKQDGGTTVEKQVRETTVEDN